MNANTYVNFCTSDIIQKIDIKNVQPNMPKKKKMDSEVDKNLFGRDTLPLEKDDIERFCFRTYQKNSTKFEVVHGFLPQKLVDIINSGVGLGKRDDIYSYNGVSFSKESIPSLSQVKPIEVKAENNIISFGSYQYFKYVSKNGQEYYMHSGATGFGAAFSEILRGVEYSREAFRYIDFWNQTMVVTEPDLPGEEFSRSEVKSYLEDAGIQPGFFTVNMKEKSNVLFYSQGKYASTVIRKKDYDSMYNNLTKSGNGLTANLLCGYEPGSVIKVGGKEYVLSESHTLDLPYGADIYDMEFPKIPL